MGSTKKQAKLAAIDMGISQDDRVDLSKDYLDYSLTVTYLMTHNFHWNTGPQFNNTQYMFMDQYTEQWNALDVIAERIRCRVSQLRVLTSNLLEISLNSGN